MSKYVMVTADFSKVDSTKRPKIADIQR